jgi:hypothetical protein
MTTLPVTRKHWIALPTSADLTASSFEWACRILEETPRRLIVSAEEDQHLKIAGLKGVEVVVGPGLAKWSWVLEGDNFCVWSEGA